MERPEYMKMPLKIMPPELVEKYNLNELEVDGWVYINIVKDMCVLPHAGKIANDLLQKD